MGKSSKKSTQKVNDAPAVSPVTKPTKKGKREAGEAIEKLVSAKKQKIDEGVKQAVQTQKSEVKTQKKKKKEESSSSDDSSSEEEQKFKVISKVPKATKPPVEESSSDESSSDEEAPCKTAVPFKRQQITSKNGSIGAPGKKGKVETSSNSSDDESDQDEVKVALNKVVKPPKPPIEDSSSEESSSDEKKSTKPALLAKKLPETSTKKASPSSSEESSDSDSPSDEETLLPTKATILKTVPQVASKKKPESSGSSDESDSDESSEEDKVLPTKATILKNVPQVASNKKADSSDSSDESSEEEKGTIFKANAAASKVQASKKNNVIDSSESESDDSSSDSDDDAPAAKPTIDSKRPSSVVQTKELKQNKMDLDEDDGEDDSSEESDDEQPKNKKVKVIAQKQSSIDEESSDESSDEESEDEKRSKALKKNVPDVEMVDASTPHATKKDDSKSAKKPANTPVTPDVHSTGSKTLFVGNLPFQVERADVENFFKGAGEIVDVRFALDGDQRFKGFGHVEFATAEAAQKALKLNGQSLNGRTVKLDLARERGERAPYTPYSSKENSSFQKGGRGQNQRVYVRGFDTALGEDEIRSALGEHFETCGDISRISIPTDYETGAIKGMAYMEFQDADGFNKALELNGSEFGDNYLTVEEARPKGDNRDGWGSGRGGGRSGGGRSGGRDGGGRFGSRDGGGRFGGRDGGGRFGSRGRGGGRGRGRGTPNKPSVTTAASGKKTTFKDDE